MKCKLILLTFVGMFSLTTFAFNESFLNNSPISYFNNDDMTLYIAAKNKALNQSSDNKKVSWANPKTNSHGYFIASNTTHKNGTTCRQLKIFNVAHDVPGESSFNLCKINGEWKVVS